MKWLRWLAAAALVIGAPAAAFASEYQEDEEEQGHVDSPTYRLMMMSPGDENSVQAHMERDLKYVDEMSEHHRGAVRMSEAYLNDPRGTNSFLRRMANAIIYNQQFEIDWLQDIKHRLGEGPQEVMTFGDQRLVLVPQGLTGMEHRQRFKPAPILSVATTIESSKPISEFDVMFAKGMKMHHEMALEMAHDYNNDPMGENRVIKEINLGILASQAVEIGLLQDVVEAYDGDADAIEIPPEMHDMMGMPMANMGMQHHH
jgi:uncharacterized protein (DUF305 family)